MDLCPRSSAADSASVLLEEMTGPGGEDLVALRGEERYAPRLVRCSIPAMTSDAAMTDPVPGLENAPVPASRSRSPESHAFPRIDPEGSYLITGGLGALGLHAARRLVEQGARRLVLTSRRGETAEARKTLQELRETGAEIEAVKADVCSERDMAEVVDKIRSSGRPLRGVVHAAGTSGYCPLVDLEYGSFEPVLRPKVLGTLVLHHLTRNVPLDFFVGFSSISSVWGSKGQAHYAAANHFIDSMAHYRRSLGLPALAVNWGPWSGGGMTSRQDEAALERAGVRALSPARALETLGYLLSPRDADTAQLVVADIDWKRFKGLFETTGRRTLLEFIQADREGAESTESTVGAAGATATGPPEPGDAPAPEARKTVEAFKSLPIAARGGAVTAYVQGEVARVLKMDGAQPSEPQTGFFELGMDSLMALELRDRLEAGLGCALPPTLVFDFPNIETLTGYLCRQLGITVSVGDGGEEYAPARASDAADGMAGRTAEGRTPVRILSEAQIEQLSVSELMAAIAAEYEALRH